MGNILAHALSASHVGKIMRGVALAPVWPLIWWQVGFSLNQDCVDNRGNECGSCWGGAHASCCLRAMAMVRWFRG